MSESTPPSLKTADQIRAEMDQARVDLQSAAIKDIQDRLKKVIITARRQVQGKQVMDLDRYLDNCSPATAVDGRLPWSPSKLVTVASRHAIFCNMLGLTILAFGRFAETHSNDDATQALNGLKDLEAVVNYTAGNPPQHLGLLGYRAYPVERSSVIYVLRTPAEQAKLEQERETKQAKLHEQREAMRSAKFDRENPDEPDVSKVVESGVGEVGGSTPEPVGEPETDGEDAEVSEA